MGQYDKVAFEGNKVTRRQRQAIVHASDLANRKFELKFHMYQGSWRPETSYSGTTHTNAGVCDLYVYGMSTMKEATLNELTRILRSNEGGRQAAQLRGPFCDMPWHWHVCDNDTTRMDENAKWQVQQYKAPGGPFNGLNSGVKSHNPWRPKPVLKWRFKA